MKAEREVERLTAAIKFAIDDCTFKDTTKAGISARLSAALREAGDE